MTSSLHWIKHSKKLLQRINPEVFRHPVPFLEFSSLLKLSSSFCTNVAITEKLGEEKTVDDNQSTEHVFSDHASRNKSDQFGNLKISLEKQRKRDKNNLDKQQYIKKKRPFVSSRTLENVKDSNEFGNLSKKNSVFYSIFDDSEPEPGDDSTISYPADNEYKSARKYLELMKKLVKQKKVKEALELFVDMKKNHVFPIHANYTFMIGACGRVGYTEMAFKLVKQMTDRGYQPTPATLTGLFNSCAECPFPDYGLKKATFLKEKIALKNWQLTQPTYHAMIKAFGKCGDILTSFQIVDEMVEAGIRADASTYSFLFVSCISDKEAGFTHAIEVWRKLTAKKISPNIYSFNLLLRAVRDCGVGPQEISGLLLQHWSSYTKRPYGLNKSKNKELNEMLQLPNPRLSMIDGNSVPANRLIETPNKMTEMSQSPSGNVEEICIKNDVTEIVTETTISEPKIVMNLLAPRPVYGPNIIDLQNILTASDRLALLGCSDGILDMMSKYKVAPDIKTFMLLLESSPPTNESETALISLMDHYKVKPDTDFFNILIKRRNIRKDSASAKQVLFLIHKYNLSPDVVTFGVLALGCYNRTHGVYLLREMKQLEFHANVEIIGALVHNACQHNDLEYLKDVLHVMKRDEIKPNERILTKIEETVDVIRTNVINKEQGKEVNADFLTEKFIKQYYDFCKYYSKWLETMKIETEGHPWDQYRTEIIIRNKNNSDLYQSHIVTET